ncbi:MULTISPECIES: alpha/beta fold hydrolase [Aeromicrobium]|uniref:Alpha/beta hydrolase n=1 Tax=Aeromicrobium phoceense TaxID=2754045 RepID=A0A838XFE6_9ACTN|nr:MULTISPECIES: alpha/beta hydrolase [Aeromicrobium]MBA4607631.1 alpha/beta hydrolase [Aeromicrobium phoceense]
MTTINAAGTTFHVEDTGEDDLPVVVCLHSLFLDHRMFDGLVEAGRGRFRFVRPEFRGQGASAPAESDEVTMEQAAGDTAAVMDALGLQDSLVVASSMGGDVAARLAAYRPDLVRALVFVGSSVRGEPAEKVEEYVAFATNAAQQGFADDRLEFLQQVMLGRSTLADPQKKDVVDLWSGRMSELPPELLPAMVGVMRRKDATPLLPSIGVPALVVSGEECPVRPPDWAAELADGLPDSELVMVPRCGHSPLLEAPDTVEPKVLDFLAAHA